ncbi:MAG TPA: hypothetical protein VHQ24_06895 [Lachnospiraceae bacterium]|nr:hypothetical protein [Lachnospiraceae bacterium]
MKRKVLKKFLCLTLGTGILLTSNIQVCIAATTPVSFSASTQYESSSVTVSNGYAVINSNTSVTKGCTISYDVAVNTTCITEKDVKDFINNNKNLFTAEQYANIVNLSAYKNVGFGAELYINMIEIVLGYPITSSNMTVKPANNQQQEVLTAIHNLTPTQYTAKGTMMATGFSNIPATPYSYIRVTSLKFADNKIVRVVSEKVQVSDKNGSDASVTGSGTLAFYKN